MMKIVSIHSFRGGTGKSNLCANLATYSALEDKNVAVIDTDIQSPGIHVLFGFGNKNPKFTLNDYLNKKCAINKVAIDMTKDLNLSKGKIFLIPSAMEAAEITKILRNGYEVDMLSNGFDDLGDEYDLDYLFIDTHPGLNEETFLATAVSDVLLVIMRMDEQDWVGSAVTLEIAKKLELPKMGLIVNKILPDVDLKKIRKDVKKNFKVSVAGLVKYYEDLAKIGSKEIFILTNPEHEINDSIKEIYDFISD
ncbi:MAG: AAA family ATPase [Candidatus Lokiarchaeota archaeon]|nr:AAA family ATPase [Candidatus Lokiarchaeota archaeon]